MTESTPVNNITLAARVLCRFRNLYDCGHFEGGSAARALLSGRNPGIFSLQIDLRGYRVSAYRAMRQPMVDAIFEQSFHFPLLFNSSDARQGPQVVRNFVKLPKLRLTGRCPDGVIRWIV